jgi:predicted alpha-1,2-mannosidase
MVADAFVKGLTGIDYEKAYRGMLKNAEVPPGDDEQKQGRGGLPDYNSIGYVSTNFERSCTRTLEYAYCDFAIASLAQALGHDQDVDIYRECSANWQNLWRRVQHDGATGFVWPRRRDGTWVEDFDPLKTGSWEGVFYETHSWEYSFYVPHDVRQVMRLSGGADAFVRRLDTLFERGYYHVDNEPGFLCPVLYLWAGRHDKTAERVREITMRHYHDTRSGLPGNDDSGAVSAWFAFHAMGFFPNAGQDVYLISSPLFERTEILFPNGRSFTIEARGLSEANLYVSSAQLNGRDLDRAWFRHSEIADGGRLVLEMAPSPGDWGTRNPPPSVSDSAPELVQTGRIP